MKKNRMQISTLLTLLLCMLLLTACGASAAESEGTDPETPPQESAAAPETEEPSAQQEDVTLEELLGEDYVNYLTETITMQMANRMEKDPEVRYFPIEDNAPLNRPSAAADGLFHYFWAEKNCRPERGSALPPSEQEYFCRLQPEWAQDQKAPVYTPAHPGGRRQHRRLQAGG